MTAQPFRLSQAPMMEWSTRDQRAFVRLFHPDVWLYSEMVTTQALIHGDRARFLDFDATEQPLVLQLGGSDPKALALCTKMAEDWGYREVNLNVGCPSDRVQHNRIGACLMADAPLVAECLTAMQAAVQIPVTIKHRIGIDDLEHYDDLRAFVETIAAQSPCRHFIVHARIARLNGLSPRENREIPPLRYSDVHRLKQERPDLTIEINGGFTEVEPVKAQVGLTDGVMIGRAAYHDPYLLARLGYALSDYALPDRLDILDCYVPYMARRHADGLPLHLMTRHILGLFQGQRGARWWRQQLSGRPNLTWEDFLKTVAQVREYMEKSAA